MTDNLDYIAESKKYIFEMFQKKKAFTSDYSCSLEELNIKMNFNSKTKEVFNNFLVKKIIVQDNNTYYLDIEKLKRSNLSKVFKLIVFGGLGILAIIALIIFILI